MSIPDFQTLMRPVLEYLADGRDGAIAEIRDVLADRFELTQEERTELVPSGQMPRFHNRTSWAVFYLFKCGLLERPRRGVYRITDRGADVLASNPDRVDLSVLAQFPELSELRGAPTRAKGRDPSQPEVSLDDDETPEERMESAHRELRSALVDELLERIMERDAGFFEGIVLDTLRAAGYGGTSREALRRLGQSGDEGVDGVIREDELGLDLIYVQAKRWEAPVGRPEIQKFFGALHGKGATKGVFITTSSFSKGAIEFADRATPRIVLVDGSKLAELMIDHGVGVATSHRYDVKRVDLDYFVEDAG